MPTGTKEVSRKLHMVLKEKKERKEVECNKNNTKKRCKWMRKKGLKKDQRPVKRKGKKNKKRRISKGIICWSKESFVRKRLWGSAGCVS